MKKGRIVQGVASDLRKLSSDETVNKLILNR